MCAGVKEDLQVTTVSSGIARSAECLQLNPLEQPMALARESQRSILGGKEIPTLMSAFIPSKSNPTVPLSKYLITSYQ